MSLEGGNIIRDRIASMPSPAISSRAISPPSYKQMHEMADQRVWETHGHAGLEMVDRAGLARIVDTTATSAA
jgi:gamma-glutamylputrescine oxidase